MRRTMIAVAITASLVNPAASTVFDPLWSLWSWLLGDSFVKEGCGIDPWGQSQCSPPPQAVEPESGCGIDPWGCPKQGS
jgi:hypothetical protein